MSPHPRRAIRKLAPVLAIFILFAPRAHAAAATLAQVIEGAKKEGMIRGQWSQNTFGGGEGFNDFIAGMNTKYDLGLTGPFTQGPDMTPLMVRIWPHTPT